MRPVQVDKIPAVLHVIVCCDGEIRHGASVPDAARLEAVKTLDTLHPKCGHHSAETYKNQRYSKGRGSNGR